MVLKILYNLGLCQRFVLLFPDLSFSLCVCEWERLFSSHSFKLIFMADTCYTGVTKNILWTARIMFTSPALCKTLCGQAHFFLYMLHGLTFSQSLKKSWERLGRRARLTVVCHIFLLRVCKSCEEVGVSHISTEGEIPLLIETVHCSVEADQHLWTIDRLLSWF